MKLVRVHVGTLKSFGNPVSDKKMLYHANFNTFEWLEGTNNWQPFLVFGSVKQLEYLNDFDQNLFAARYLSYKKAQKTVILKRQN
jgi:hypothetical protein